MKAGDRIRVTRRMFGVAVENVDFTVEEFRHCLGIFQSGAHREAGRFTPLCDLYEPGPDSEEKYVPNFGPYNTDMVQAWMDLPSKHNAQVDAPSGARSAE